MLLYTADLKRPLHEPAADKHAAVDAMLLDLGLDVCKDTIIGDALHRGISGGQVMLCGLLVHAVLCAQYRSCTVVNNSQLYGA